MGASELYLGPELEGGGSLKDTPDPVDPALCDIAFKQNFRQYWSAPGSDLRYSQLNGQGAAYREKLVADKQRSAQEVAEDKAWMDGVLAREAQQVRVHAFGCSHPAFEQFLSVLARSFGQAWPTLANTEGDAF